jgi:hypothetical protein
MNPPTFETTRRGLHSSCPPHSQRIALSVYRVHLAALLRAISELTTPCAGAAVYSAGPPFNGFK